MPHESCRISNSELLHPLPVADRELSCLIQRGPRQGGERLCAGTFLTVKENTQGCKSSYDLRLILRDCMVVKSRSQDVAIFALRRVMDAIRQYVVMADASESTVLPE